MILQYNGRLAIVRQAVVFVECSVYKYRTPDLESNVLVDKRG
jgi:hypothetical protein